MTPLERMSRLRSCEVFRSFNWPGDLPELSRFDLICRWNATGKTTLSRAFSRMEKRAIPQSEVTLELASGEFEGEEFPNLNVSIRVFNRVFVNGSVFRQDAGLFPPNSLFLG